MSDATSSPLFTTPENLPPSLMVRRQIFLPAATEWLGLFNGAFSLLCNDDHWLEREGGVSIEDTVQVFREAFISMVDNYMIGMIVPVVIDPLPDHLLLCDGANYSGDDYPALYAVIGDEWKIGDGTFVVPNLQGRFVIGAMPEDDGEGNIFPVDHTGGAYKHTLSINEMPSHTHVQDAHNHTQNSHGHTQTAHNHILTAVTSGTPGAGSSLLRGSGTAGNVTSGNATPAIQDATATNQATTATNQNTGGGEPHNNLPPYRGLHFAIIAR